MSSACLFSKTTEEIKKVKKMNVWTDAFLVGNKAKAKKKEHFENEKYLCEALCGFIDFVIARQGKSLSTV